MQPQMGQPPQMMAQNQMRMQPQMGQRPQMGQPPQMNMPVRMAATGGIMNAYPSNYFAGALVQRGLKYLPGVARFLQGRPRSGIGGKGPAGFEKAISKVDRLAGATVGRGIDALRGKVGGGKPTGPVGKTLRAMRRNPILTGAGLYYGGKAIGSLFEDKGIPEGLEEVTVDKGLSPQEKEALRFQMRQGFAEAASKSPFPSRAYAESSLYAMDKQDEVTKEADKTYDAAYAALFAENISRVDPDTGETMSPEQADEAAQEVASRIAPLSRRAIDITEDRLGGSVKIIGTKEEYDELTSGTVFRDKNSGKLLKKP
tara:strand:- start:95 stop:1036 length:942 start_codon:yes stop_codon:yes gene_type:complete